LKNIVLVRGWYKIQPYLYRRWF